MYNDSCGQLRLYRGFTLVDITKTDVVRANNTNSTPRNQQRNWETLVQVLGLRAQLTVLRPPEASMTERFSQYYPGIQRVWSFQFGIEHDDIFSSGSDQFGTLYSDFANVPVIVGLTETAKFTVPTFDAIHTRNIYFEALLD